MVLEHQGTGAHRGIVWWVAKDSGWGLGKTQVLLTKPLNEWPWICNGFEGFYTLILSSAD